jgi:hypothetical protein
MQDDGDASDSDRSDGFRSDGFTQALQKLQDASQAVRRPPANPVTAPQAQEHPTGVQTGVNEAPAAPTQAGHALVDKAQKRAQGDAAAQQKTRDASKAAQPRAGKTPAAEDQAEVALQAGKGKGRAKAGAGKGSKAKASGNKKDREQNAKGHKQQRNAPKQKVVQESDMNVDDESADEPPVKKPQTRKRRRQTAAAAEKPESAQENDHGNEPKAAKKLKVQNSHWQLLHYFW